MRITSLKAFTIFLCIIALRSFAIEENWENSALNIYKPPLDDDSTFIKGNIGNWLLFDTVGSFPEDCGETPHTAEITKIDGSKVLRLNSGFSDPDGGCADNVWIAFHALEPLAGNNVNIPITPNTYITFDAIGELIDPDYTPWYYDKISLCLIDIRGNELYYVIQRHPNAEPQEASTSQEIFLDPDAGHYARNLFEDFSTIPHFDASGGQISVILFSIDEHGWATLDNLNISESAPITQTPTVKPIPTPTPQRYLNDVFTGALRMTNPSGSRTISESDVKLSFNKNGTIIFEILDSWVYEEWNGSYIFPGVKMQGTYDYNPDQRNISISVFWEGLIQSTKSSNAQCEGIGINEDFSYYTNNYTLTGSCTAVMVINSSLTGQRAYLEVKNTNAPTPTHRPTSTPTPMETNTPTNTQTYTPLPIPTDTHTFTPLPTSTNTQTFTPLPTPTNTPEVDMWIDVDMNNLIESPIDGFQQIDHIQFTTIPIDNTFPDATDGQGLEITLQPGQGTLFIASMVDLEQSLLELRASVRSTSNVIQMGLAAIAVGTDGNPDGSMGYVNPTGNEVPVDEWGEIHLLYDCPTDQFYPALQLVLPHNSTSEQTVYVDNFQYAYSDGANTTPLRILTDATFDTISPSLEGLNPFIFWPDNLEKGSISLTEGRNGQGVKFDVQANQTARIGCYAEPPQIPAFVDSRVWVTRLNSEDNGTAAMVIIDGEQTIAYFIKTEHLSIGEYTVLRVGGNYAKEGQVIGPVVILQYASGGQPGSLIFDDLQSMQPEPVSTPVVTPTPASTNTPVPTPTPDTIPTMITVSLPNFPEGVKSLDMVLIEAGTFLMGSPASERGRDSDETQHEVTLTRNFYIGQYEITQAQYEAIMGSNPSHFSGNPDNPVENVTWYEAAAFCNRVSEIQGLQPVYIESGDWNVDWSANGFRLPTEAEWEYACRAGTTERFYHGDVLDVNDSCEYSSVHDHHIWWCGNNDSQGYPYGTKEVGLKSPNPWNLFDMHGNVYEWCNDWYGLYDANVNVDPHCKVLSSDRVRRGGSWYGYVERCRSANRDSAVPNYTNYGVGFRIVFPRTPIDSPIVTPTDTLPTEIPPTEIPPTEIPPTPTKTPTPADEPTPSESIGETITIHLDLPASAKTLDMVRIPAGTFIMGSPASERGRDSDETQHEVTLTNDFYIGQYEITQAQYESVIGNNPSWFGNQPNNPVENVTWYDAASFCNRLSESQGLQPFYTESVNLPVVWSANGFRLPTEAEWEYACRAGTTWRFSHGNVLEVNDLWEYSAVHDQYMWWCGNDEYRGSPSYGTREVGTKSPNPWGLFDMHGNLWEWCNDWYGSYDVSDNVDPKGPVSGSYHVFRGGVWFGYTETCRSANRNWPDPNYAWYDVGFRVVLPRTPLSESTPTPSPTLADTPTPCLLNPLAKSSLSPSSTARQPWIWFASQQGLSPWARRYRKETEIRIKRSI